MDAEREPAPVISLDEVRSRFIEAEDHLRRVAASITAAEAAGTELRQSRESLTAAADALIAVAGEVGKAATGFADHDAALARAIELLAAADPASVREDLALLRSMAIENREAAARQRVEIAEEMRSRMDTLRNQTRITLAVAVLTLIGVIASIVVSRL